MSKPTTVKVFGIIHGTIAHQTQEENLCFMNSVLRGEVKRYFRKCRKKTALMWHHGRRPTPTMRPRKHRVAGESPRTLLWEVLSRWFIEIESWRLHHAHFSQIREDVQERMLTELLEGGGGGVGCSLELTEKKTQWKRTQDSCSPSPVLPCIGWRTLGNSLLLNRQFHLLDSR